MPYSLWIKTKHITKPKKKQKMFKTNLFLLIVIENLTDIKNLSGPPDEDSNYTVKRVFNEHDPLDSIPLSKTEMKNIFSTNNRNNDLRSFTETSSSRPNY